MATRIQFRRGTSAQHASFTGAVGEMTVDTDKDVVVVHDGSTAGGFEMLKSTLSNIDIGGTDATGKVILSDGDGTYSWAEIKSVVRKQTFWENSTRWVFSNTTHQSVYSISFTKDEGSSDTDIWVTVQIPNSGDYGDSMGWYCGVDTGGAEPSNDGPAHKGVIYIASEGNHKGATLVHKKFSGLSAGSHTINLGWNPRSNASDRPSLINPNGTSDDNRNHQTSSTVLIQEVEVMTVA